MGLRRHGLRRQQNDEPQPLRDLHVQPSLNAAKTGEARALYRTGLLLPVHKGEI
jgi:hypothetical protein